MLGAGERAPTVTPQSTPASTLDVGEYGSNFSHANGRGRFHTRTLSQEHEVEGCPVGRFGACALDKE
jgi:hypothetical protein